MTIWASSPTGNWSASEVPTISFLTAQYCGPSLVYDAVRIGITSYIISHVLKTSCVVMRSPAHVLADMARWSTTPSRVQAVDEHIRPSAAIRENCRVCLVGSVACSGMIDLRHTSNLLAFNASRNCWQAASADNAPAVLYNVQRQPKHICRAYSVV